MTPFACQLIFTAATIRTVFLLSEFIPCKYVADLRRVYVFYDAKNEMFTRFSTVLSLPAAWKIAKEVNHFWYIDLYKR